MDEVYFYLKDLASRFPKDRENYYLSYSGGKDSHFLYWFIKEYMCDNKIQIVSANTYMEHPEILARMRKNADIILLPKLKPFEIKKSMVHLALVNHKIPLFMRIKMETNLIGLLNKLINNIQLGLI